MIRGGVGVGISIKLLKIDSYCIVTKMVYFIITSLPKNLIVFVIIKYMKIYVFIDKIH